MTRFLKTSRISALLALLSLSVLPLAHAADIKVGDQFGDWVFECTALGQNKTACALTQTLVSEKERQAIAKFTLTRNEEKGGLMLTVLTPLGIHLQSGVGGSIDQKLAFQYTLVTCLQQGCIATYTVDSAFLKSAQAGQKLNLTFTVDGGKKPIALTGSLKGLIEGIKTANLS